MPHATQLADQLPYSPAPTGQTYQDLLLESGALPLLRVLQLGRALCAGIAALHGAGLLHGALEPEQLLVLEPGTEHERLTILGVGPRGCAALSPHELLARASNLHYYASPEHVLGARLDARSDVYSIGALLYELCAGEPPFTGEGAGEVLCQHLDDSAAPPSARLGESDLGYRALDKILLRCLAKLADERYPSALALEHDLARLEAALLRRTASSRMAARAPVLALAHPAHRHQRFVRLPKVLINDGRHPKHTCAAWLASARPCLGAWLEGTASFARSLSGSFVRSAARAWF